jgi:hypothetical protein
MVKNTHNKIKVMIILLMGISLTREENCRDERQLGTGHHASARFGRVCIGAGI